MYRKSSLENQKLMHNKVSDARSYLMMLVSSLMDIKKVQQETKMPILGGLDNSMDDLAYLDEILEKAQEKIQGEKQ